MEQNLVITQIVTAIITTIAQIATLVEVIIYTIYTAKMTSAAKYQQMHLTGQSMK